MNKVFGKIFLTSIVCFLSFSSFICHKVVTVSWIVKNKSNSEIYVKGQKARGRYFMPDTVISIPDNKKDYVFFEQKYCWFGDCRVSINNGRTIGEVKIFKDSLLNDLHDTENIDVKVKRSKVMIIVN